jgi:CrcB protein
MVFIGGGLGAAARFSVSRVFPFTGNGFPWGTFIANVLSCIILGFVMAYSLEKGLNEKYQILLITGFCGGFSTFSTFSAEAYRLLLNNQWFLALLYVLASLIICVLCILIGIKVFHN